MLEEIDCAAKRTPVTSEIAAVTLVLADGEINLGDLVSRTANETFAAASDVESELNNVLPRGPSTNPSGMARVSGI